MKPDSKPPANPPPPKKPPVTTRPPTKPPRRTGTRADALIFAEADRIRADLKTPARLDDGGQVPAASVAGGPVQTPACELGEPPVFPARVAADSEVRAGVDPAPARFALPPIPTVPSFDNVPRFACRNAERAVPCACWMCTPPTP